MNWHATLGTDPIESLPPPLQRKLAEVLEGYLADLEQGRAPAADELVAGHPELAEPLRAYLGSLEFLHRAAAEIRGSQPTSAVADFSEKRLGDYQILRQIGRGGMGVVYEAQQVSLDRRVALKVLPFAAVLNQKQIARFQNEARAAAQLHHPNIVPVFSVGCERGVHYYAMQYVEGQPLDVAIGELRRLAAPASKSSSESNTPEAPDRAETVGVAPGTWKSFSTADALRRSDYFRAVAELGIQAAGALQHAHEYGIIHRDVKPSNLLLDGAGKLWITDFGLARFHADANLTATGDVMGTVRYMSPEQAAGRSALVDGRTDVYSLGITLYELLTLRDAFDGVDRQEFLRRIADEDPPAPRRINPAVPIDLETIVLKAISKAPDQRYTTAGQLADDLHHFLDGEPISARRPRLPDRLGKWARRHKTVVTAAAVLAVVVLVGLAAGTLLIAREHSKTKAALAQSREHCRQAQENLLRAETHFRQARRVVDRFGARHAERLASIPGAEPLRRELLRDTLNYYHEFIEQAGDDPTLQADLAVTYSKTGSINEQIGHRQKALEAYRKARRILERLAADQPKEPGHRADLALCHNNIALLLSRLGKTPEARRDYRRAIKIQKGLAREDPQSARFRSDLALSYNNLGLLQNQTGQAVESEASYRAAVRIQKQLADQHPDEPKYLGDLAVSHNNLSFLYAKADPGKAEDCCRRALAIQEKLVRTQPAGSGHQSDLALSYNNLGALQNHMDRPEEAMASYGRAIEIQQQLVRKAPSVVRFRRDLAVSHNNLGRVYSKSQRSDEANREFEQARAILEDLVSDCPNELSYRSSLGGILNNLGMVFEPQGRLEEAAAVYRKAVEHQRFAHKAAPRVARFREFLARHHFNHARVLRALGREDEAAAAASAHQELTRLTESRDQGIMKPAEVPAAEPAP